MNTPSCVVGPLQCLTFPGMVLDRPLEEYKETQNKTQA